MSEPLPGREVDVQDWAAVWDRGVDPPFHKTKVNEGLRKYSSLLFHGTGVKRVFVPLCGKTIDLIYLADLGHEVVGLEYVETGVVSFFKENGLSYARRDVDDAPFEVYKADEKNIPIYRGDLFDLKPSICGQFDAFWDRGSYVAINMSQRVAYADLMFKLMNLNSRYLLEAVSYDGSKFTGPPHYVTCQDLKETFGRNCSVEFLESKLAPKPGFVTVDLIYKVTHYMIRPKTSTL